MDWMRVVPVLVGLAVAAVSAGELTQADRQRNVDSFEKVWTTVRDRHWDPSHNGVDWLAVHDEFRPKVEQAKSNGEARAALQSMLARLKQTHFGIVPSEAYDEIEDGNSGRDGTPGLDTRLIGGRVIITSLQPGSPAATAGLRPGWELRAIGGKELAPAIAKITGAPVLEPALLVREMVRARLAGAVGIPAKLEVVDGAGRVRSFDVDRAPPRGVRATFGHLRPVNVLVEWRKVAPNAGYLALNLFFDPENVMKAVGEAVSSCMECDGFIIDLRGNPGGIGGMAMGVAGFFVDTPGRKLGTMATRASKLLFAVSPRARTFRGPLAILVDECSASTAEIFAEGMKDLGRARVFGVRTAGAALPSSFEKLPNGDGFQYAFADYISESGKRLEGAGVDPDVDAPLTREALLEGRDPALDAALEWIRTIPKKG